MGMDESGEMDYESVVVSADGRMVSAVDVAKKTSRDNQLTSVALVNEVIHQNQHQGPMPYKTVLALTNITLNQIRLDNSLWCVIELNELSLLQIVTIANS